MLENESEILYLTINFFLLDLDNNQILIFCFSRTVHIFIKFMHNVVIKIIQEKIHIILYYF